VNIHNAFEMTNTLSHPGEAYAGTLRVDPIQLFEWDSVAVILAGLRESRRSIRLCSLGG